MLSVLKLSLPLNHLYMKIVWKNLQNWDDVTKKLKLGVYKFRIDFKENDVTKCLKVLLLAGITVMQLRTLNAILAKISYLREIIG